MTAVLNDGKDSRLQIHEDRMIHKLGPLVCGSSVVKILLPPPKKKYIKVLSVMTLKIETTPV